ncbi:MAG: PilZ domain-containing protein [Desulfobacterales bacterium]
MYPYLAHFNLNKDPFIETSEDTPQDILSESDTEAYINKSLAEAGMHEKIFQKNAIQKVHSYSKGDLKLINAICSYALQRSYFINGKSVHNELLSECLELLLESKPPDTYPDDKRRHKRLTTDFPGTFHIQGTKTRGTLTVSNISHSGIMITLNRQRLLKNKDRVGVSFKLDDEKQSDVRTVVIVRHTFGFNAGCIFNYLDSTIYTQYINDVLERREAYFQKYGFSPE